MERSHFYWGRVALPAVFCGAMVLVSGCSGAQYRVAESRCGLLDCQEEASLVSNKNTADLLPEEVEAQAPEDSAVRKKAQTISKYGLRWPLKFPVITSKFGYRDPTATRRGIASEVHDGIDLRAGVGTPIYASHDGKVVYAGQRISGYGKMVVIKHPKNFSTLYAHQSRLKVRAGQWVKRGRLIGYSGATGNVSGPHLHFEVRLGTIPVDPVLVLRNSGSKNRRMAGRN